MEESEESEELEESALPLQADRSPDRVLSLFVDSLNVLSRNRTETKRKVKK